jgi:hypothetical protein
MQERHLHKHSAHNRILIEKIKQKIRFRIKIIALLWN